MWLGLAAPSIVAAESQFLVLFVAHEQWAAEKTGDAPERAVIGSFTVPLLPDRVRGSSTAKWSFIHGRPTLSGMSQQS